MADDAKILSLLVFKQSSSTYGPTPPVLLASTFSLGHFGFFQRSGMREVCTFVSREIVQRSTMGQMLSVKHLTYMAHSRVTSDGLGVVAVCDEDYPRYVAFSALREVLEAYSKSMGETWKNLKSDQSQAFPALDKIIEKYQDPTEADKIMKIKKELDETKQIVIKNIEQLLERNDKLEDLIQKSNDLSFQSKAFAKRAEDMNRCCTIL